MEEGGALHYGKQAGCLALSPHLHEKLVTPAEAQDCGDTSTFPQAAMRRCPERDPPPVLGNEVLRAANSLVPGRAPGPDACPAGVFLHLRRLLSFVASFSPDSQSG